jgi:hypothetical protein
VVQVLDRALDALITQLERRKAGAERAGRSHSATDEGTGRSRTAMRPRYIPAPIRRAVWERDRGQCTFVGADGHRCTARRFLEFDHREPVARGGKPSVEGIRLRCRTHNQYEAERVFGVAFMRRRRQEARRTAPGQADVPKHQAAPGDGDPQGQGGTPGPGDAPGRSGPPGHGDSPRVGTYKNSDAESTFAGGPLARDATETPPTADII